MHFSGQEWFAQFIGKSFLLPGVLGKGLTLPVDNEI